VITEQELELALDLRERIKKIKATINELEQVVLSSTQNLSSGVTMGGVKVAFDAYTRDYLVKFKEDIMQVYKVKLEELQRQYKNIIEAPGDTLRRIIEEND